VADTAGPVNMSASLSNQYYFPVFKDLPTLDEIDANYYTETNQGMLQPSRTWCFVGEIVHDSLSQMPVLGNRVEVRDASGAIHSIMFYPTSGTFNFSLLKAGHTIFVRYASRVFFSDLATEAIKVDDLNFVKAIPLNLDALMYVSQLYFEQGSVCGACFKDISGLGGSAPCCDQCGAARYCSLDCKNAASGAHATFCGVCSELQEVYNIDFERFIQHIPFRV